MRSAAEFVLGVKGIVEKRPEGMANPDLKTGEIEVMVSDLKILNRAQTPPFLIEETCGRYGKYPSCSTAILICAVPNCRKTS